MDFVDGGLGGCLRGGFLHLLADGAEGLAGGSSGGGGSLVHAPPGFVMQPLKVSGQGGGECRTETKIWRKLNEEKRFFGRKGFWQEKEKRKREKSKFETRAAFVSVHFKPLSCLFLLRL